MSEIKILLSSVIFLGIVMKAEHRVDSILCYGAGLLRAPAKIPHPITSELATSTYHDAG